MRPAPSLQAYLHRTEADCRDLAYEGSRVRLCKGAYKEPESVAFQDGTTSTSPTCAASRCCMAGQGYPMVATPRPAADRDRPARWPAATAARPDTYEFQMLYGIRPEEQKRLADRGRPDARLRALRRGVVRLPHAPAGRAPANLTFFLRSLDLARTWPTGRDHGDDGAMTVAIFGAGVMGETLLSGLVRAGRRGRRAAWSPSGAPSAPPSSSEKYGVARASTTPRRPRRPTPSCSSSSRRTWAALLDEIADHVRRGQRWSSASPPASRRPTSSRGCPQGVAGRAGHAQHPGPGRRGHGRDLAPARTATTTHLAEAEALLASTGKVLGCPRSSRTPSPRSPARARPTSSSSSRR